MTDIRFGNFTSSEIVALMTKGKQEGGFGKPAVTYIDERNMERRLGRSLTDDNNARPLSWGKLVESRVFEILGLEYILCSTDVLSHPTIECWKGTPDAIKSDGETVGDIKCPITLKSFCSMVDAWKSGGFDAVRSHHRDGEKYYWQLVSNAVLTGAKYAELIVYCPYQSELEEIRDLARNLDSPDQYKYAWVNFANDNELPYLVEGGYYQNLNVMRFEVPNADKELLRKRVVSASEFLVKRKTLVPENAAA